MYIRNTLITGLAAASTVQAWANFTIREEDFAISAPEPVSAPPKRALRSIVNLVSNFFNTNQEEAECPAVWFDISSTLTQQFLADGQCTDAARAAIRSAFHDCFNGACDGSLILANECQNTENKGLSRLCSNLANVATQTQVGVADLIQFAAAHAVKTCPGGPTVPVKVGRTDSNVAAPTGILPGANAGGGDLVRLFASKGFTPTDLSALIGAHTTAKQFFVDPSKSGAALDSTVGTWDSKYYSDTLSGKAPFVLQSDKNVARNPATALSFNLFAHNKPAWDQAFVSAMVKMSMLGVQDQDLVDCTSALPGGSKKRDVRRGNVWARLMW